MLRILLVLSLSSAFACGDDDDSCPGPDGCIDLGPGTDGGPFDASMDAGETDGGDVGMDSGVDGGAAVEVDVTWTFPAVTDGRLPGYLAHLLGEDVDHPFDLRSVCAAVENLGPETALTLRADLVSEAAEGSTDATLAVDEMRSLCAEPEYDLEAIQGRSTSLATTLSGSLRGPSGEELDADEQDVTFTPGSVLWWTHPELTRAEMLELAAVFVRPDADGVSDLIEEAASLSAMPDDFSAGYTRPDAVIDASLTPGARTFVSVVNMLDGEVLNWSIDSVSGGGTVDVHLFTGPELMAWDTDGSGVPTTSWLGRNAGDMGTYLNTAAGQGYFLVAVNPGGTDLDVVMSRSRSELEIVDDALRAFWNAIHFRYGITVEDLAADYFDADRVIRTTTALLEADAMDAAEATISIASAIERLGLEATLIVTDEAMMVGVRTAPGGEVVVPIDMTLPSSLDYQDARNTSFGARISAMSDPASSGFSEADITTLRARGVAPIP